MRGNGICTAVLSLVGRLQKEGVEVRVMSCANPDSSGKQPDYPLKHFKFPIFEPLIETNGFRYATFDKNTAIKAIAWADVIHLHEGFPMEAKVARLARKMGKPCVGTFHMFSENIMANIGLRRARLLNSIITKWWRNSVYDLCSHIHCPTEVVREYLLGYNFGAEMRVFSNGMDIIESEVVPCTLSDAPIVLLCVGRFANEKSQNTLLDAMRFSKYADRIQLHFAGKGPRQKRYERQAKKLLADGIVNYPPKFEFYDHIELKKLIKSTYLYIHCAWVEVEGLSCAEAIREGVVPIIAKGRLAATSQFALDDRSIFPAFDARALAEKIDWWIEHPEQRIEMGAKYAESIKRFNADNTIQQMIQMYRDSIAQC